MQKNKKTLTIDSKFCDDNSANMRIAIDEYKNVLVCGIRGVGKIIHTLEALAEEDNVYYLGNPVDFEGKMRPGSDEKYVKQILSVKKNLRLVDDADDLLNIRDDIHVVIDEIFGRTDREKKAISKVLDMANCRCIQIVGCMKYMEDLIKKIDMIVVLEPIGAFTISPDFSYAVSKILMSRKE